jgi:response regulator RpfG family c-di-GMP phosphodiesterase
MPQMDGVELAQAKTASTKATRMMLILVCGVPDVSHRAAEQAGIAPVVTKPFRNSEPLGRILKPVVSQPGAEPGGIR